MEGVRYVIDEEDAFALGRGHGFDDPEAFLPLKGS